MIVVEQLSKRYGGTVALHEISFRIKKGAVVGLLGPNGAGKTTTLRVLSGVLGASHGRVWIAGHDLLSEPMRARQAIAYLPETPPLYPEMRVEEYLSFRAALRGLGGRARRLEVGRVLSRTYLDEVARAAISTLSRGYCQRVGLAATLLGSPPILLLDEPTLGLDPNQIREIRSLLIELREHHTIVLSTHILSEVETLCDSAIVLYRGGIVAEGSIAELVAKPRERLLVVQVRGDAAVVRKVLEEQSLALHELHTDAAAHLEFVVKPPASAEPDALVERLVAALLARGLGVLGLTWRSASLDEVFRSLTEHSTEDLWRDAPKSANTNTPVPS